MVTCVTDKRQTDRQTNRRLIVPNGRPKTRWETYFKSDHYQKWIL